MTRPTDSIPGPVERFLGRAAAAGGPFAILGLTPEDCSDELIIVQLQRQLARVAANAQSATPEADEVRITLHAAAARLLEGSRGRTAVVPPRAAPAGFTHGQIAMEQAMLTTLAQFGGWNSRSMHHLTLIAQSQRISQDDLVRAVQGFGRAPGAAPPPRQQRRVGLSRPVPHSQHRVLPADAAAPLPEQADPTMRVLFVIGGVSVVGLALLSGVIWLVMRLVASPTTPVPIVPTVPAEVAPAPAADRTSPEYFPSPGAPAKSLPPPVPRSADFRSILADLRACTSAVAIDPADASTRFAASLALARETWITFSPDQIIATQDAVVEFIYRISGSRDLAERAVVDAILGLELSDPSMLTPSGVRAVVFSAGLTARLAREKDLPAGVVDAVQAALKADAFRTLALGDATFAGGAGSAVLELASKLTPSLVRKPIDAGVSRECWSAWSRCLDALGLPRKSRDRIILRALDALLRDAPEPLASKPTFDAIALLASLLAWTPGEDSRATLIRWFDDAEISIPDLHAVTTAVVAKGLGAGVDSAMVLSAGAADNGRMDLRERYREAWGDAGNPQRAGASTTWLATAEAALARSLPEDPIARLAVGAWFSSMNHAAEAIWAGRPLPPISTTPDLAPVILPSGSVYYAIDVPTPIQSDAWASRYLAAQSRIPERRQLLAEYQPGTGPDHRLEAILIVREAVRGSPADVRAAAREIVRKNASDASFVGAMLDEGPTMPLSRDNARLAEFASRGGLPSLRNPAFRVALRRVLVERLLELISGDGDLARVDLIAGSFARSYDDRASLLIASIDDAPSDAPAAPDAPPGIGPVPVEESARALRVRLQAEADQRLPSGREPLTLDQIAQRRVGRLRAAQGRVQAFAAEQACAAELLAFLVASESPTNAAAVAKVLDDLAEARRCAAHVADQIEAAERATLRLWIIRLKGDAS